LWLLGYVFFAVIKENIRKVFVGWVGGFFLGAIFDDILKNHMVSTCNNKAMFLGGN
jgi:hypothetical protein